MAGNAGEHGGAQTRARDPGHYLGTPPAGTGAIDFTRDYLQRFEKALSVHKDSAGVISTLKNSIRIWLKRARWN